MNSKITSAVLRSSALKRIGHFLSIVLVFILSPGPSAYAQGREAERNATAEEITGDWQQMPFPISAEPKLLKVNPWPATCQWFSYASTGVLKSIDRTNTSCETMSAGEFEKVLSHVPSVASWKYDLSPVYQKALIIVSRSDAAGYAEYWMPHIVTQPTSKDGVDFHQGDLLLYLVDMKSHQIAWIRHLRRME